jgi:uncharacterized protein (DUF1697 family)
MAVRIALLRGVNVGGAGRLPMAEFRAMLEGLGLAEVRTFIQSGNAVFESALPPEVLEAMIRDSVAARFGFAPETFVRTSTEVAEALTGHPFAGADPACVHVFFVREAPRPDEELLRAFALPGDGWQVGPRRFTLHTPGGIGRSKLAARLEKLLPGPMTARNLRTLAGLMQMVTAKD